MRWARPTFVGALAVAWGAVAAFGAWADTLTVGPGQEYATISAALAAAGAGDSVVVLPGLYAERITFPGVDIILQSTDPEDPAVVSETIIDGRNTGTVVTFSGSETQACELTGFTIRNGNAANGGGINGQSCSATISHNVVTQNSAVYSGTTGTGYGGGLYECDGLIEYNVISENSATQYGGGLSRCAGNIAHNLICGNSSNYGGGLYECGLNGTMSMNSIIRNTSNHGGGAAECDGDIARNLVYANTVVASGAGLWRCDMLIAHNTIWNNTVTESAYAGDGGGLYNCNAEITRNIVWENAAKSGAGITMSSGAITGNLILDNEAYLVGAGLAVCHSPGVIRNNIIAGNRAAGNYGGAIYGGSAPLENNVVYANVLLGSGGRGGGVYMTTGAITNCIFWANEADQYPQIANSAYTDSYVQMTSGDTPPGFVDAASYDFRLAAGSPCIDAGNAAAAWNDACIPPGKGGERNDMGAYGGPSNCTVADNAPPTLSSLSGVVMAKASGSAVITWNADDPDDDALITLLYDLDNSGADGLPISGGISEDSTDSYTWALKGVPGGTYYLCAIIADGNNLPVVAYSSGTITVESACDVDHDGEVNAIDVQLVINEALGLDTGYDCDIDSDGDIDAVDVQLVINGALGFPC